MYEDNIETTYVVFRKGPSKICVEDMHFYTGQKGRDKFTTYIGDAGAKIRYCLQDAINLKSQLIAEDHRLKGKLFVGKVSVTEVPGV